MPLVCERLGTVDCPLSLLNFAEERVACEPVQSHIMVGIARNGFEPADLISKSKDEIMTDALAANPDLFASTKRVCRAERTRMNGLVKPLLHELGVDVDLTRGQGARITELELARDLARGGSFTSRQLAALADLGINA